MSTGESQEFNSPNYTDSNEQYWWWLLKRWSQDRKASYHKGYAEHHWYEKRNFRMRRWFWIKPRVPAFRTSLGKCDDIGAFVRLTNSYVIIGGNEESKLFSRTVKFDLPEIAVVNTSVNGCRTVGCLCVGNKRGLLVPESIYDTELQQIKEQLPDSAEIKKLEDKLSALGNVIACNDRVALIHPELDKESEETIADTLQVEVFRHVINDNPLVGSYCVLNNHGGLVSADTNSDQLENLSSLLNVPAHAGTVNRGIKVIATSLVVNDGIIYAGMKTSAKEFEVIQAAFQVQVGEEEQRNAHWRRPSFYEEQNIFNK